MQITTKEKILKYSSSSYSKVTEQQREIVQDFNERVRDGKIEFESVACLCGGGQFDVIGACDRYGILQTTMLCIQCGLILSNPRMTERQYLNFYSSDLYRRCYEGDDYISVFRNNKYRFETGKHIFDEIAQIKSVTPDTNVLELGAGGGWNLLPFIKERAKVVGMDYSPSLVDLGQEYDINMIQGGENDVKGTYDVIILNHVLEHFLNPIETLKKMQQRLAPEGIIYIGVPNIVNFGLCQLQNAHVWYFSPRTFEYYCGLAGLQLLKNGSAEINHMFGIFKSVPSNVYTGNVNELDDHYEEMCSVLRTIAAKECMKRVLSRIHLDSLARAVYKRFCSR